MISDRLPNEISIALRFLLNTDRLNCKSTMKIREKKWGVLLIVSVFSCVLADVSVFDIGTQEPKHTVSERFLSLSVDPKELLDGVNIR